MAVNMKTRLQFYAIQKEKRLELLKKQKEEREMSEVQQKPKISQKSLKLIEKKRNLLKNNGPRKSNDQAVIPGLGTMHHDAQAIRQQYHSNKQSGQPNSREFWGDFIAQHYDIENKRASVACQLIQKNNSASNPTS